MDSLVKRRGLKLCATVARSPLFASQSLAPSGTAECLSRADSQNRWELANSLAHMNWCAAKLWSQLAKMECRYYI